MKRLIILTFFICSTLLSVAQTKWDSIQVKSEKVTGNIYMLTGSGGNIGVITGADGVVMIDDQFLPLGPKIKDAIQALDSNPIRFTINTHIHGDHSGSNEFFKQLGSTIVAHDVVRERMMKVRVVDQAKNETIPPRDKDAWPAVTFSNKLNLHLNGQDIELIHFAAGHTDGDVIVRFSQANVFHMGDVFVTYGYPYIDAANGGNINGLISALDQALVLMDDNSKIIPGHGNISTKVDVKKYRDRLANIRDQVAAALKKGKKTEEITGLGITNPYDEEWGKGFIKGKDFVLVVAESLKAGAKK
jgi:glyoxylase-like metal-dependent hydrolase (beta-lactamase superfamily II)